METTVLFGLITAPTENIFTIGCLVGYGAFALLLLIKSAVAEHLA